MKSKPTLTIMTGLPRSGKSTYSKNLASKTNSILIVLDEFRLNITNLMYKEDEEPYVWYKALIEAQNWLIKGFDVIIDESNNTINCLKYWIDSCKDLCDSIKIVKVNTSYDTCYGRATTVALRNAIKRKNEFMYDLDHLMDYCKNNNIELEIVKGE